MALFLPLKISKKNISPFIKNLSTARSAANNYKGTTKVEWIAIVSVRASLIMYKNIRIGDRMRGNQVSMNTHSSSLDYKIITLSPFPKTNRSF